jgi:hypothetical protein
MPGRAVREPGSPASQNNQAHEKRLWGLVSSHRRLRCGISRCAARAGLSSRSSSYTSWITKAGGCYGAVAWRFSRIPTAPSRLSATALASPEHGDPVKGGVLSARQDVPPAPLRRICTALVGTEGRIRLPSGEVDKLWVPRRRRRICRLFRGTECSIHLPSSGESANYHSSVTGVGWSIPLSLILSPGSLFCPGRRGPPPDGVR